MDETNDIITPADTGEEISMTTPEKEEITEELTEDSEEPCDENTSAEEEEPDKQDEISELITVIKQQSSQIELLSERIDKLSSQVNAANKAIAVHEEIERNLNSELQRYKNDFYDKLSTPFLMQLIGLYIDISDEISEISEEYESDPEKAFLKTQLDSLGYYADSVKGALINNGVEIKTPETGSSYDYKEQRISKTVPTDDETLRDCIAQARSDAFVYNGKVLRPAKVVVYKV